MEKKWLLDWVYSCVHTKLVSLNLPLLADGAEHWVYLDQPQGDVIKVTKDGIYGDYYYLLKNGKMAQANCAPLEYLIRMQQIEFRFEFAPLPLGITERCQIVCRQQFISGDPPNQAAVDQFLIEAGFTPVKQQFWLWKGPEHNGLEDWVGDARADNFVSSTRGIIPIDLRMWLVRVKGLAGKPELAVE